MFEFDLSNLPPPPSRSTDAASDFTACHLLPETCSQAYNLLFGHLKKRKCIDTSVPFRLFQDEYAPIYCILRKLYKECRPWKNPYSLRDKYFPNLNFSKIEVDPVAGMTVPQLEKFVKQNQKMLNVKIKVCLNQGDKTAPMRRFLGEGENEVYLVLVQCPIQRDTTHANVNEAEMFGRSWQDTVLLLQKHYWFLIKDIETYCRTVYRIPKSQQSNLSSPSSENRKRQNSCSSLTSDCPPEKCARYLSETNNLRYTAKTYHCELCFGTFRTKDRLTRHRKFCKRPDAPFIKYPGRGSVPRWMWTTEPFRALRLAEEKKFLKFEHFNAKYIAPMNAFLDLEAVMDPLEPSGFNTQPESRHRAIAYSFVLCDRNNKVLFKQVYANDDCIEHLFQMLFRKTEDFKRMLKRYPELPLLSEEEMKKYEDSNLCHICEKEIKPNEVTARDHDHYDGTFYGKREV